tara:strand:- start:826 stop:1245 length:420 start_codon:yes stop_codon:yes gene_type:complete
MAYEDDDNSTLVKDLRDQIETLSKENKTLRKANDEFVTKDRTQSVAELIKEKNLNPKVAGLIPKDVNDVAAWLDEYGDLFGLAPTDDSAGDDAGADGEVDELDRQNASESLGSEDSGLLAKINATTNLAELQALVSGNQ